MAIGIVSANMIRDSGISVRRDDKGIDHSRASRTFLVGPLSDGSYNQSATALARSLKAFGIPQVGQIYDKAFPRCWCRGYDVIPATEMDDYVELRANFESPDVSTPEGGCRTKRGE